MAFVCIPTGNSLYIHSRSKLKMSATEYPRNRRSGRCFSLFISTTCTLHWKASHILCEWYLLISL